MYFRFVSLTAIFRFVYTDKCVFSYLGAETSFFPVHETQHSTDLVATVKQECDLQLGCFLWSCGPVYLLHIHKPLVSISDDFVWLDPAYCVGYVHVGH